MHGFSNSIGMRFCLNSSFHTVLCQDFKSAVSVSVFCCCWNVILDSRLSQDSRRELRRWLTKVWMHAYCNTVHCNSFYKAYSFPPFLSMAHVNRRYHNFSCSITRTGATKVYVRHASVSKQRCGTFQGRVPRC